MRTDEGTARLLLTAKFTVTPATGAAPLFTCTTSGCVNGVLIAASCGSPASFCSAVMLTRTVAVKVALTLELLLTATLIWIGPGVEPRITLVETLPFGSVVVRVLFRLAPLAGVVLIAIGLAIAIWQALPSAHPTSQSKEIPVTL